jgi:hypothetical protein
MTDQQPLNREQRRAARFRPGVGRLDPHDVIGRAEAEAEAEAAGSSDGAEAPPEDAPRAVADDGGSSGAHATSGSGDVVHTTGPGAGGATESDGRMRHHEGSQVGHPPKR